MQTKMKPVLKEHQRTVRRELTLLPLCTLKPTPVGKTFTFARCSSVWFSWGNLRNENCSGFLAVKAMIEQEVKNGIPSHRIILGGFSQVRLMIVDF